MSCCFKFGRKNIMHDTLSLKESLAIGVNSLYFLDALGVRLQVFDYFEPNVLHYSVYGLMS